MWNLFCRKNKSLMIRRELKNINKKIKRATFEQDAAWVEELMEEKYRLIETAK
ncbi:hypothetical protein AB3N04_01235 (plasmid) [Alkalihalophilus sp. As8PL]|uniref:Uncharacterized protein n=1 Tax=Alkalihalophilus sp. As8PL TaxID=3237103 RepID=A0AB39BN22_9BACI